MKFKTNYLLAFACFLSVVSCNEPLKHNATNSEVEKSPAAHKKSREIRSYVGMISCAMKFDSMCFLNVAEDFLVDKKNELLAQADAEALRATGRSDDESKPSQLAGTLSKLVSQIASLFQNGFGDFFKEGKEVADDITDSDEEEDDDEEEEETEVEEHKNNGTARSSNGDSEGRAEKKKTVKKFKGLKGLIRLIKIAIIAGIVVLKIVVLIKLLQTALQFKLMLVAVGTFAIQVVKFWQSLKHNDHQEISYHNPYASDGIDFQPGPASSFSSYPGSEYGPQRSFVGAQDSPEYAQNNGYYGGYAQDREYAQDLAYSTQKP